MKKTWATLIKETRSHPLIYTALFITLVLATFVRVYRVNEILGFYFDQGRDAKVIWDFWHEGKLFLVGPTTGIAGIFRGPFYYYLIAPFYLLGGGNPIYPATFLSLTTMLAILILFYLGVKIHSREAGLVGAVIASFSYNMMIASRWLSNPTPMLLLSMVLVWMMLLVSEGKKWAWMVMALVLGLSLFHFGSSGELFYFPAVFLFAIWQRKNLPSKRQLLISILAFFVTLAPLLLFDLRHGGILRGNLADFLFNGDNFKVSFWEVFRARILFYYDVFSNKIFHWRRTRELILLGVVCLSFLVFFKKLWKKNGVKILLLLFISPLLGLLFFQGNFGNIYDYYLTGYYFIFILLFAIVLGELWRFFPGKLFILYFFFVFLTWDGQVIRYKISAGFDGEDTVVLGNQMQAVEWVYQDSGGEHFSLDVYVPPVIPHAYDYLFTWYAATYQYPAPLDQQIDPLYTLYESDPPHPERLRAWLDRQKGIGVVEKEVKFGGITVQKRKRI